MYKATKSDYRDYFEIVELSYKMSTSLKEVGISRNAYSRFMRGEDNVISIVKLEMLCDIINADLRSLYEHYAVHIKHSTFTGPICDDDVRF
ncbi:hypothetical protein [Capybara microvirus Cap3_SP_465]|nr:hypothetical protein [Capybara microvirus Cap3_SP_465]